MNTIKIKLSTSGRVAALDKNFPLYCGQFQNVLLNIYVPTEILAPDFDIQHYIGNTSGTTEPSNSIIPQTALQTALTDFCVEQTGRQPAEGDVIFYTYTTGDTYYRATYTYATIGTTVVGYRWIFTEVPYFAMGNFAGTNVKVGVIATESNGTQFKSKSYYCRYVKTLTSSQDGVQYALYERKMPREFTATIGSGQAARTVIINVVNSSQEKTNNVITAKVENIITSQTVGLDVLPSTALDEDEPIDATAQEELWEAINSVAEDLAEKQDKKDADLSIPASVQDPAERTVVGAINDLEERKQNKVDTTINYKSQTTVVGAINKLAQDKQESTDNSLLTESKTIVGAINEVKGTADAADTLSKANKNTIDTDIQPRLTAVEGVAGAANGRSIQNATDIAALQAIVGTGEDFIGTLTVDHEVTNAELTAFVNTTAGRAPKGGDSVIVIQQVAGGTDKTFKYIYNGTTWEGYEIPAVELASNGTAGLVSGTYAVDATANTIVNIVGGEIQNIYVKDGSEYRDIRDFLLANKLSIANIIDGTTVVKEAETATKDSAGDNIASSFAAIESGATKVGAAANADAAEVATKDSAGNNIATQFSNIVDGTTQVGSAAYAAEALKATQDALGNNIVNTYLTQLAGATKQYVKDYALPKEFNNVMYFNFSGDKTISETLPSASQVPAYATFTTIGEHDIFSATYTLGDVKFQLSQKNSFSARLFISGSGAATVAQFKMYVYAKKAGQSQVLMAVDLLPEQAFPTSLTAVDFGAQFTSLNNTVIDLTTGDEVIVKLAVILSESGTTEVYVTSTETYASRINLNTAMQTLTYRLSEVGQAIFLDLSALTPTVDGSGDLYYETDNADLARVVDGAIDADITILLPNFGAITGVSDTSRIYISVDGGTNYFTLSTAEHATAVVGDLALSQRSDNKYIVWGTYHGGKIDLDVPKVKSYVDALKSVSGTATVAAASWSGTTYTLTISGLGANDSIFFTPSTTTDQENAGAAGLFFDPTHSAGTVTITADTAPVSDIDFDYTIVRG